MADEIYNEDYVGEETAWHHKGVTLGRMFDAREAIEYANLGYEIQMIPLFTADGQEVDRCATIRADLPIEDPNRILGIVGTGYIPVQNRD
ncbi:hypothetical protein KA005_14760, partial [bacterium]|nr:hypothetical protein [bacterium]